MFSVAIIGLACVPTAEAQVVGEPSHRRCEAMLARAIVTREPKAQRDIIIDVLDQVSRNGDAMPDTSRRRLAFLAGVLIQTSGNFDCRMTMASIFDYICDGGSTPGFDALVGLYKDAQAFDAAVAAKPMLALPTGTATSSLHLLFDQLAAVRPWVRLEKWRK